MIPYLSESPNAIAEGPAYVHTPTSRYWHRVRSGRRYDTLGADPREAVLAWCGQGRQLAKCETADEPPVGAEVCATCEGRAAGAGQASGVVTVGSDYLLRFAPRIGWCPGSNTEAFRRPASPAMRQVVVCDQCGTLCVTSTVGGPYNPREVLRKHRTPADEAAHLRRQGREVLRLAEQSFADAEDPDLPAFEVTPC